MFSSTAFAASLFLVVIVATTSAVPASATDAASTIVLLQGGWKQLCQFACTYVCEIACPLCELLIKEASATGASSIIVQPKIEWCSLCNNVCQQCSAICPICHHYCIEYQAEGKKIKEVHFSDGKAGATSSWSSAWVADHAFEPSNKNGWHTGPPGSLPDAFPVMIWYQFKQPFLLAELSFRSRQDGGDLAGSPSKFQIVGSNDITCDKYSTWTILFEDLSAKPFTKKVETRSCKVKEEMNEKFRCVGLRVLDTRRKEGWCSLNNIRMWERV